MLSKAFLILAKPDRVWHRGLLFKFKKMGIVEDLLLWFKDYLFNRKQRVIINGKESSWKTVNAEQFGMNSIWARCLVSIKKSQYILNFMLPKNNTIQTS
jgi:hypothetical protein